MAEWKGRNVLPMPVCLADEHQLLHQYVAPAGKLRPSFARDREGSSGLGIAVGFQNRQVGNIGPDLRAIQSTTAKLIVQLPHAISRPLHLDEHGGGGWQKCFHVSQLDPERDDMGASLFQEFHRRRLASGQLPRRKNREMGGHVLGRGMELLAEVFYKLANRIAKVRHQCVA